MSLQITISPDKRAAARFIGRVRRSIQKAYIEEQRNRGLSQSDIARALGVHRSVINRELRGFKNLTLSRVAELAWALNREPNFLLDSKSPEVGQNVPMQNNIPTKSSILEPKNEFIIRTM